MNDSLGKQNIDVNAVVENIQRFTVETPSWGYSNSGTRFKVFPWPGAARTLREKLSDAAEVQKGTGICPSVAIHIPWDKEDDWRAVKDYAHSLGLRIGAVNPNLFQEDIYRFGSLCHFDKQVRSRAIEHVLECIQIAREVGSDIISLWLADGTNYPGQDDLRRRRHRLLESLQAIYAALPAGMRFCIFNEIVGANAEGNANAGRIAYMINQSHNIEPKVEAMIQSVLNVQTAYAKAQLVDRTVLRQMQEAGDVLGAYRVLQTAYETDVRPLLSEVRVRQGRNPDPIAAFRASGYAERVAQERVTQTVGSGFPGA